MKSKVGIAILIVAIVIAVSFLTIIIAGGISLGGGKKVTIMGTVYYNMITGWGVTYDDSVITDDDFLATLWYMPWETKDIEVKVELSDGKTYSSSAWTDKLNLVLGSTSFSVDLRHVSDGTYSGKIFVYEVEKGLIWGEKNRVLQATTSFTVTV